MGAQRILRGRFEIVEEIGEGGFARVYHARETTTGQKVALKVLKDAFQNDKEVIERFRREVFAVASINSPHVVGLKDFGISGDEFFIAMEFVEGPTLRDVIEERQWSASSVHTLIGQVGAALEAAHAQNIVHRDLKPENVMLVAGPRETMLVKVLDFGLAKLAELERTLGLAQLTRVGMCFGTPQYMSPELIYGRPVDRSVDLFALGVMAYEMIAGRRPWDGDTPQEVMVAVAKKPLPPITRTHVSMRPRLEIINRFFQRALAKRKEDRPSDVTMLMRELSEAILGEQRAIVVPARPDFNEELSAIHSRIPGFAPRPEETQIDSPAVARDHANETGVEKTLEFSAVPHHVETPSPPRPDARSGRLASAWIPSMPNTPSLSEGTATDFVSVDEPSVTRLSANHSTQPQSSYAGPAQGGPRRSPWLTIAVVVGILLLLTGAASVGFLIGRGH